MTKSIVRSVFGITVLAVAGVSTVSAAQPRSPTTSPAHFDTFTAAQKALEAGNCAVVKTKANEVLAAARKTADDTYAANVDERPTRHVMRMLRRFTKAEHGGETGVLTRKPFDPLFSRPGCESRRYLGAGRTGCKAQSVV